MVAGSGISENVKRTENAGITEIAANTTKNIPAKNNFFIPSPLLTRMFALRPKKMDRKSRDFVAFKFFKFFHYRLIGHRSPLFWGAK